MSARKYPLFSYPSRLLREGLFLCALFWPLYLISEASNYAPDELLIRFKSSLDSDSLRTVEDAHGLTAKKRLRSRTSASNSRSLSRADSSLILFDTAGQSLEDLKAVLEQDSSVDSVSLNYLRYPSSLPDDTDFDLLWALNNTGQSVNGTSGTEDADIDFPEAWELSRYPSSDVVVAVVDTGMSFMHPDLNANVWTNPSEVSGNGVDDDGNGYVDDIHGYDFGTDSAGMYDSEEHGTHVAGTIGAVSDNGIGIAGVSGSVSLLPLKVEDADGNIYTSDIIEAFLYAVDLKESGVNLVAINASLGGSTFSDLEYDAISDLNDAGIILCAAAGNDGSDNDSDAVYPASYDLPNVISVASVGQSNALSSFSNYGSTSVDLAAPGENIYSTLPISSLTYTSSLSVSGSDYLVSDLEYAGATDADGITAELIDCGLGYTSDFPDSVDGNIALIQRGEIYFSVKVENAKTAGAVGVLIYNNTTDVGTSTWTLSAEDAWLPALKLSQTDGETLLASLPVSGTLVHYADLTEAYQYMNGTSMATPHVSGAVAFAALNFPDDSVSERVARILDNVTLLDAFSGIVSSGGVLNLQNIVDTDADSLGDWWETENLSDLSSDGTADSDGDGFTDAEEFLSLTDPSSASDFLSLENTDYDSESGATLSFQSAAGRNYQVYWSDSLDEDSWEALDLEIEGDGSVVEIEDSSATDADKRFYRLEVYE
jgi:subtilisin family serine protease